MLRRSDDDIACKHFSGLHRERGQPENKHKRDLENEVWIAGFR